MRINRNSLGGGVAVVRRALPGRRTPAGCDERDRRDGWRGRDEPSQRPLWIERWRERVNGQPLRLEPVRPVHHAETRGGGAQRDRAVLPEGFRQPARGGAVRPAPQGYGTLRRQRLVLITSVVLLATLWVYACGDGTTEPRPYFPEPTAVTISPASAELTALGSTVQLSAEVLDQGGRVMDGVPVTWLSAETTVATVNASGLVTAVGNGAVTITATAGEASGDAVVTIAINPDRAALVALYNATDGPNWVDNTNWLTDAPLGEWYGVGTNAAGRVVRINLSGDWDGTKLVSTLHGLSGAIPPELGDLTELERLTLGINALSGPIPPELGGLANLKALDLDHNALTGEIPPELGDLQKLESLSLDRNTLSGEIPPEFGDLANLERLYLWGNALTGEIPPELGGLANLERLYLARNSLSGEIPQSFLQLDRLWVFFVVQGQDVCVPGASAFVSWFNGIRSRDTGAGVFCNATDVAALESLYDLTDGANWTESDGWLDDNAVEDWYGVTTDALGHVTELDLEGNGLAGRLSGALGNLHRMTVLRIADNALDERLPLSLTALDLDEFHYDGTDLCEPPGADFRRWLEGIASRRGTGVQCAPLSERDVLTALYASTGGSGWTNSSGWLTEAPLRRWFGVEVNAQGRVVGLELRYNALSGSIPQELGSLSSLRRLHLGGNALSGEIPPELGSLATLERLDLNGNALSGEIPPEFGDLANLERLYLWGNALTGEIPPELGGLANLEQLYLARNSLSGEIPPELGSLSNLWSLYLGENELAGPIPPELGSLSNLWSLYLGENELTGPIPPDLGNLANLRRLHLANNTLSGAIPPTFGGLARLTELVLSHNPGLAGAMPADLRNLALESLIASGTDLCVPRVPAFEEWLATIPNQRIATCGEPPAAYLVQAVQSRSHPVPLVAGEDALLRVFVTAAMETIEGIPDVRARFYLNGTERHVADIPGSSTPIPTEIDEGNLETSANAEIPGWIVRPGLEMVVEIDPDGALDASLGVARRIPQEGRLAVEVREIPVLDLTVIPFLWNSDPDSAIIGLVEGMATDPEGHHLLEDTHVLLPVAAINVTAHAPVASTSNSPFTLLGQTEAIRVLEGGGGHYMGMMSGNVTNPLGVAHAPGRSNFSQPYSGTIAHELGHNMSLGHAPCGVDGSDPSFPYPNGTIGAWGYDFLRGRLVPAARRDYMSYCDPDWTSDYHFTNALGHRLDDEGASKAAHDAATVRSLLLWGGVDTTGTPFLNPAFVADAPPALPDSAGDYTVTGRNASGKEAFSLSFPMLQIADGDGSSSFAFALPAQPGWGDALASVTLSGPAGTTTLDGNSDIPMAILRDPRTGKVRGMLRDPLLAGEVAADVAGVSTQGLEVLFSRGIPSAAAWRR